MGYRSEVAIVIVPDKVTPEEFLTAFAADQPKAAEAIRELAKNSPSELTIGPEQIRFYSSWTKWYTEYPEVIALEVLADWARDKTDNSEPPISRGCFLRAGEEAGDTEETYWGDDAYNLGHIYVTQGVELYDE